MMHETTLTPEGLLQSDLWPDQPTALEEIQRREQAGECTGEEADRLRRYVRDGYCTLSIDLPDALLEELERAVERAWKERPPDLAFAYKSPLQPFTQSDESRHRRPSCRIADLHSHSEAARHLYLHPDLHAAVGTLFGQRPVATQSLYFEYGSQQPLHRDPVHVYMVPPSHLAAAWVALEDIGPDCGPLCYVPGSHRLPYYEFEAGSHVYDHLKHGDSEAQTAEAFDLEQCRRAGLSPVEFQCKRGDVLIWHHSLLHGGTVPRDPRLTRKSFVVHYSTMAHYESQTQMLLEREQQRDEGALTRRQVCYETVRVLAQDGCYGFDNPLRGRRQ